MLSIYVVGIVVIGMLALGGTAIVALQSRVKERTRQLDAALDGLKQANEATDLWRVSHAAVKEKLEIAGASLEKQNANPARAGVLARPILLNRAERLDAFRYAPEHPLWKAILDELNMFQALCVAKATDPTLTDKETFYALGGTGVLDDFRLELEARQKESLKDAAKERAGQK